MDNIFRDKHGRIVKQDMYDEHDIIFIQDKFLSLGNIGRNIRGEVNSQIIQFECNRYLDKIDLRKKDFYIIYKTKDGVYKEECKYVCSNENRIRFCWVLSGRATKFAGELLACIQISSANYITKTLNFSITILDAIDENDVDESTLPKNWKDRVDERLNDLENSCGGSTCVYTDTDVGSKLNLGGIKIGEKFDRVGFQDLIWKILHPYEKPQITIGVNPTNTIYDIVNDVLSSITISANVIKKTEDIQNVKFYVNNKLVSTITSEVKNGGIFKYKYIFDTPKKETFTVKVETCDAEKSIVYAQTTITFIGRTYVGFVEKDVEINEESIKALLGVLKKEKKYSYEGITTPGDKLFRICYCYPKSMGDLKNITDTLNFPYMDSYTKTEMTIDGILYLVYYLTIPVSVTDFLQKYE